MSFLTQDLTANQKSDLVNHINPWYVQMMNVFVLSWSLSTLERDIVALVKVETRGIKKLVIQNCFCMSRDKVVWESVCWKGGKLKKCVGGLKSDLDGKVNYEIVIHCLSEQKN